MYTKHDVRGFTFSTFSTEYSSAPPFVCPSMAGRLGHPGRPTGPQRPAGPVKHPDPVRQVVPFSSRSHDPREPPLAWKIVRGLHARPLCSTTRSMTTNYSNDVCLQQLHLSRRRRQETLAEADK